MSLSGDAIIGGLLSETPETVLETLNALQSVFNQNDVPGQLVEYLKISPLCIELLQIWSKYLIEGTTFSKKNTNGRKVPRKEGLDLVNISDVKDHIETVLLIKTLNCISTVMECFSGIDTGRSSCFVNYEKDNAEKLGMLIITKYMLNIYRQLTASNKDILASTLRLLASISNLSEAHKEELLNTFNFSLQQFVSISKHFECVESKKTDLNATSYTGEYVDFIYEKRESNKVRFQYLRFIFSFIRPNKLGYGLCKRNLEHENGGPDGDSENEVYYTTLHSFLAIKGIGNSIFKNSSRYDDRRTTLSVLCMIEKWLIDNRNVQENAKRLFFNMTVLNYMFNSLNELLGSACLDVQLELVSLEDRKEANWSSDINSFLFFKYKSILGKLFGYHINVRTRLKTRLVFNWLGSLKSVKYPILQEIAVRVYRELSLSEKISYLDTINISNFVNNSCIEEGTGCDADGFGIENIDYILVLNYVSKLLNYEYGNHFLEKRDLVEYLRNNDLLTVCVENNSENRDEIIQLVSNWVYPNKLLANLKTLNTKENVFVNVSIAIIQINVLRRLEYAIERINEIGTSESIIKDFLVNKIRQSVYSKFPDMNSIISILRFYFNKTSFEDEKDVISTSLLQFRLGSRSGFCRDGDAGDSETNEQNKKRDRGDHFEGDDLFVNVMWESKEKSDTKVKVDSTTNKSELSSNVEKEISRFLLLYHNLLLGANSDTLGSIHCNNVDDHGAELDNKNRESIIRLKFGVLKLLLELVKCILKGFSNEFLLSMGYKFDYTRIMLDEIYREYYMNTQFINRVPLTEYRSLFENQIHCIIMHSLHVESIGSCYWNCNKYLLYRFLDGLASTIYKFKHNGSANDKYVHDFFIGIWIEIASNMTLVFMDSREEGTTRIFHYLDPNRVGKYVGSDSGRIRYLHFKFILFIFKTILSYSALIRDYAIRRIDEELEKSGNGNRSVCRELINRNLDLVLLLILVSGCQNDALMETMNIKNGLTSLKSDLESFPLFGVEKNCSFNKQNIFNTAFYDYILGIVENMVLIQVRRGNEIREAMLHILENIFSNWISLKDSENNHELVNYDLNRDKMIRRIKNSKEVMKKGNCFFANIRDLLFNIKYYYSLLCETGIHAKYNMNNVIGAYLLLAYNQFMSSHKKDETHFEVINEILELNFIQMKSRESLSGDLRTSTSTSLVTTYGGDDSECKTKLSMELCEYLKMNKGMKREMLMSFMDVITKFNLNIDLILSDKNKNVRRLQEILLNQKLEETAIWNMDVIHTVVKNISSLELVLLTRRLALMSSKRMKSDGHLPALKLIERVAFAYTEVNRSGIGQEHLLMPFNICFCNLLDVMVESRAFDVYNVALIDDRNGSLYAKGQNVRGEHEKLILKLPLSLFEYNGDSMIFGRIMTRLLPHLFFNSKGFYDSLVDLFSNFTLKPSKLPIGIQLLYVFDKNLQMVYSSNKSRTRVRVSDFEDNQEEDVIVKKFARKLVKVYNKFSKLERDCHGFAELKESFESLSKCGFELSVMVTETNIKSFLEENLSEFIRKCENKSRKLGVFSELNLVNNAKNKQNFWEILDLFLHRHELTPSDISSGDQNLCVNRRGVLVNSGTIFSFVLEIFNRVFPKESSARESGDNIDLYILSEITYLTYLLHYDRFRQDFVGGVGFEDIGDRNTGSFICSENRSSENSNENEMLVSKTLISSYSNLLELFKRFDLGNKKELFCSESSLKAGRVRNIIRHYCYYYILLTPIIMDKYINPLYELMRLELNNISVCASFKEGDDTERDFYLERGYKTLLSYKSNHSFYDLLIGIGKMDESRSKYPVPFIETSKILINDLKSIFESMESRDGEGVLTQEGRVILLVSSFMMYVAKNKQCRRKYGSEIYDYIPNFVLLKMNRINLFLSKMHQLLFDFLSSDKHGHSSRSGEAEEGIQKSEGFGGLEKRETSEKMMTIVVIYMFIERVLSMEKNENTAESGSRSKEESQDGETISVEYLSAESIHKYLKTTRISELSDKECIYNRVLTYSRNNYHGTLCLSSNYSENIEDSRNEIEDHKGVDLSSNREKVHCYLMKTILCNHSIYRTSAKINDLFGLDKHFSEESGKRSIGNKDEISDVLNAKTAGINVNKLTRYWYHFYSIYLENFTESSYTNRTGKTEFNWMSPDVDRVKDTVMHFPFNSRLISNNSTVFEGILGLEYEDVRSYKSSEGVYDIGYVIPIINSRFKLAYSMLRERGFYNSKKNTNPSKNRDENNDQERGEENSEIRTCSGFIEDYPEIMGSKFDRQIDNDFIWLRNFCKNGSLRLVISSLSCIDFSIRYYSYQIISLLFEIVNFHLRKYMDKCGILQKQDKTLQKEEESLVGTEEGEDEKNNVARPKKKARLIRHIFKELPQVYTILNTLKNTVSGAVSSYSSKHENCIRLSSFITGFLSESIEIIFKPESCLFKTVNYFLLSRPFIDRYDIPLFLSLLYSEDPINHLSHKSFMFNQLETCVGVLEYLSCGSSGRNSIELEQEHDAINRRFVVPLLLNYVKTNNMYSQYGYFSNLKRVLSIILCIIGNQSFTTMNQRDRNSTCNFESGSLIGNSIIQKNPNIPSVSAENLERTYSSEKLSNHSTLSSLLITQSLLNQYSIIDFVVTLIQQLTSLWRQENTNNIRYQTLSENVSLMTRILLKIVKNTLLNPENNFSPCPGEDRNPTAMLNFKNKGSNANRTILKLIGGYGNTYTFFQKLLRCIEILHQVPKNGSPACVGTHINACNCNHSILSDLTCHPLSDKSEEGDRNKILLFELWFHSYFFLLYVSKHIFGKNKTALEDLIHEYQKAYIDLF